MKELILSKESTENELRTYFRSVLQLSKSDNEFPINLNEVWMLVYPRKDHAVRDLTENFIQDVDYQVFLKNGENPLGGRPTNEYYLSVSCMEFFIARKIRPVFEVYRQVFHRTVKRAESSLLQDRVECAKFLVEFLNLNEVSKLQLAKSIADPLGLPTPDYVPSKGVLHSAKALLEMRNAGMTSQSFNKELEKLGYLERHTRPKKNGKVGKWYVVTTKGLQFGENQVCPQNPKQTQALWYDNTFDSLLNEVKGVAV